MEQYRGGLADKKNAVKKKWTIKNERTGGERKGSILVASLLKEDDPDPKLVQESRKKSCDENRTKSSKPVRTFQGKFGGRWGGEE